MLDVGFGRVCITPARGVRLAGFAARQDVCRGVHDDLYARAIVLRSARAAVALVSVDVLALPSAFVDEVRAGITRKTGIPSDAVLVACTHTHSAPVTISTFFNPGESVDPEYMARLKSSIEASVVGALRDRFPARAGMGTVRIEGFGVNRRSADGKPVDEEVAILRVTDVAGRNRAVLVNYACHPTVLGPDNVLATGDFPAAMIKRVETALGPDCLAMFINGTQGNIGPGHSSELSAIGVIAPGRTFERAAELGNRLGDTVLSALNKVTAHGTLELGAVRAPVKLRLKKYPTPQEAAQALEAARCRAETADPADEAGRRAKTELLYASIVEFYAREAAELKGSLTIELQAMRVGDAAFIGIPAEVFVEIGLRIKRAARRPTFIAGLANGYIGYFPDRHSYAAGGYEVVSAKVDEHAEDKVVSAALELEGRLFQ